MKKEGLKFLASRIFNCESKSDSCSRKFKLSSIADDHFFLQPGEEDRSKFNYEPTNKKCTDPDCEGKFIRGECNGKKYEHHTDCFDFSDPEDDVDELEDNNHELNFLSFKAGISVSKLPIPKFFRWTYSTSKMKPTQILRCVGVWVGELCFKNY